jgi:hypothetical protein
MSVNTKIFPGCFLIDGIDQLANPEEWRERLVFIAGEMGVGGYRKINETFEKTRSPEEPRNPLSGDMLWHNDLMRERRGIGNLITGVYFHQCDSGASPIEIMDTSRLYEITREITIGLPRDLRAKFSEMEYARTLRETALNHPQEELRMAASEMLNIHKPQDDKDSNWFPFFNVNPFSSKPCLFFDGGQRCETLFSPANGCMGYPEPLSALKKFIYKEYNELLEAGAITRIEPAEGRAVIFSRIGTMHRSTPGDKKRRIFLSWLAERPPTEGLTF